MAIPSWRRILVTQLVDRIHRHSRAVQQGGQDYLGGCRRAGADKRAARVYWPPVGQLALARLFLDRALG